MLRGAARTTAFALLPAFLALALAEGTLRLASVGNPYLAEDPFAGFEPRRYPAFLPDEDPAYVRTNPARRELRQGRYARRKTPGTFRALALGESNVQTFDMPRLTEALSGALGAPVEAINAGASSFGSQRIAFIAEDYLSNLEIDLVLIYMGHNEYLERSFHERLFDEPRGVRAARRLFSRSHLYTVLRSGVRALRRATVGLRGERDLPPPPRDLADPTTGADVGARPDAEEEPALVYERFRFNLDRVAALAERAGARVIVATPARNHCYAPNSPCRRPPLSVDEDRALGAVLNRQRAFAAAGSPEEAIRLLEESLSAFGVHSGAEWELALRLEEAGRAEEAAAMRRRALDDDCVPLAATSGILDVLRAFARDRGYRLVDFAAALESRAPDGVVGDEYLSDYCHLNAEGQAALFRMLADAAAEMRAKGEL